MSAETLKVQIIQKAWADPAFKQQLLQDPKAAISQAFGIELPEAIELNVVEETPTSYVLVIPPNPEDVTVPDGSIPNYVWA
ncbi:NHLP leader peptide family RiPP precursor [Paenibacillus cymbidii]|uniref:NHLP leader peptide family RiPP precursor n=1 Tax=Paenibacillus cymbidii TaxID=1639034 RepID=UPI0010805BB8|nr:NHLP leader peptide family RiPP precursor [Paenibacillus cymbidii]